MKNETTAIIDSLPNLSAQDKYACREHNETFSRDKDRTKFERDRDRILFSKPFRRLSGKTQVFLSSSHDHIRTRLTHTLEVSQISRTIASKFKLNEALTEAIALGHDIGHTPFGHAGERTLCLLMCQCDKLADFQEKMEPADKGFKHNWQSVRVASKPEAIYGKDGLNLTNFTLWGIKNHSREFWEKNCPHEISTQCHLDRNEKQCKENGKWNTAFYQQYNTHFDISGHKSKPAWSFEGHVVKLADEIAQRHHDIEDALHMKIVDCKELYYIIDKHFADFAGEGYFLVLLDGLKKQQDNVLRFLPIVSRFIVGLYKSKRQLNPTHQTRQN